MTHKTDGEPAPPPEGVTVIAGMPLHGNPGVTQYGRAEFCNEPLMRGNVIVGYCERLVKCRGLRPPKPHRGPHRVEWWSP